MQNRDEPYEIKVTVLKKASRKYYQYRWYDPVTGQGGEASSRVPKTASRTKAAEGIPAFRAEKMTLRPAPDGSWEAFCKVVKVHLFPRWSESMRDCWGTARRRFEAFAKPLELADVTEDVVLAFRYSLKDRVSEATIDTYLRTLRVALREGAKRFPGYIAPPIRTGRHAPGGRPLLVEEFRHLLSYVEIVVGKEHAPAWRQFLRGAVWSGLRKKQLIAFSWHPTASVRVETFPERPMIVIERSDHKGKRTDRLPMTPRLVRILKRTPPERRKGRVFKLPTRSSNTIGEVVAEIGERAGITTGTRLRKFKKDRLDSEGNVIHRAGDTVRVARYASLHDLKRTFVQWMLDTGLDAVTVSKLAQHTDLETTVRSYTATPEQMAGKIQEAFRRADKKKLRKKRRP